MTYLARAAATVTIAGSALAVVTWTALQRVGRLEALVLTFGVMVLATALLLRSWHRASLLARALVTLGIAVCSAWLYASATLSRLLVLEGGWQEWLPPLLVTPLPVLLLLSLLAFMDPRSTGGSRSWAALLLGWYGVHTWSELARLASAPTANRFDLQSVPAEFALTLLGAPLFEAAVALGLAQLLASVSAERQSRA
jgi:hypothetical protein